MSGSGDVSLTIFITSKSGSESTTSFTNRFFHLSEPPGCRLAFNAAERNGRFGRFQCQRSKESSSRGKRKRRVFLCKRTVRVKVKGKVIPINSLKIEERRTFAGEKEGRLVELVNDQNPGLELPPRSRRGRERWKQKRCQEKSGC